MDKSVPAPSRRTLLGSLALAPLAAGSALAAIPLDDPSPVVVQGPPDDPIVLRRTAEGRALSAVRYETAEEFFPRRWGDSLHGRCDFFYNAGVTAQLGISSWLLDIGVDDAWCARNIGYRPARALYYANAFGFGYGSPRVARLAHILTPYWKWNALSVHQRGSPSNGGFSTTEVQTLLRALLDHIGAVTGHGADHHG